MILFGNAFLIIQLLLCVFAVVFSLVSLRLPAEKAVRTFGLVIRAVQISAVMAIHVLVVTAWAFLNDNFSIAMVAGHSASGLAYGYKISAIWASAEGSFLIWTEIMVCVVAVFTSRRSRHDVGFGATSAAVCSVVTAVFIALLLFEVQPFAPVSITIDQGSGLNPLLQNVWMVIHPPLLFVGYSLLLIPFAMTIAGSFTGLYANRKNNIELRHWLLAGFAFLSLGIASGAKWAYIELGWGGFWGWDPVENASLLPWLVTIAALHSLAVSRKTNRSYTWTAACAGLAFILCLVATFITRSGVVQSVHSFGTSVLASALLAFIGFLAGVWLVTVIHTWRVSGQLGSNTDQSYFAKPNLILCTNLVLIFLMLAVGLGTLWPAITSGLGYNAITPSRIFYDRLAGVSGIVLVVLVGSCWFAKWSGAGMTRNFAADVGSMLSHVGLIIFVAAVSVSIMGESSMQLTLAKGDTASVGNYQLRYERFRHEQVGDKFNAGPELLLSKGTFETTLWPYNSIGDDERQTAEVGLYSGLWRDVYVVFERLDEQHKVMLTVYIKPMMSWLWGSMLLIVAGALVSMRKGCD